MGEGELVVVSLTGMTLTLGPQAEGHEGETSAGALRHDDEALSLQVISEVVGGSGQVGHDGAVTVLAETDELVVLANDLRGTLGEVEGEGGLVGAEVVDVEDELLGEVLGSPPDDPADTGVDEAVLVAGDVDGDDLFTSEIPLEVGDDKGGDETTAGSIDVDGDIHAPLNQEVVDGLDILVLTSVSGTENSTDTDGVLVAKVNSLIGVQDEAIGGAHDELLLNLKVSRRLFPADLDGGGHDNVGFQGALALGDAAVLPFPLHGQDGEHDGFRGADGGGADGSTWGSVEEVADHVDAAVLDVGGLRVLFIIDEVLGEGLGHELLSLIFL